MKLYLATWLEDQQGETLSRAGCGERLLSYLFLRQRTKAELEEYFTTGQLQKKRKVSE